MTAPEGSPEPAGKPAPAPLTMGLLYVVEGAPPQVIRIQGDVPEAMDVGIVENSGMVHPRTGKPIGEEVRLRLSQVQHIQALRLVIYAAPDIAERVLLEAEAHMQQQEAPKPTSNGTVN